MTDPRKRAADLFRRACDGSSEHEAEACLRAMADLVRKHNLVHAVGAAIEGVPTRSSDLSQSMDSEAAREEQRHHDIQRARIGARMAMAAVCDLPWEVRRGKAGMAILHVVARAVEMPGQSIGDTPANSDKLVRALKELIEAIQTHPVEARLGKVADAVQALFEADPAQPGADAVARKLGMRAADVRTELKRLIDSGEIEAVGKGRARRHRRLDPRPE